MHYILFVVVHPRYAAKGALTRMARDVLGTEAAEGVLLVFDDFLLTPQLGVVPSRDPLTGTEDRGEGTEKSSAPPGA